MTASDERRPRIDPTPPRMLGSRLALIMFGLSIGLVLMALQLWLLTLAYDLFSLGNRTQTAVIAGISGVIFAGGLVMLWLLERGPRGQSR